MAGEILNQLTQTPENKLELGQSGPEGAIGLPGLEGPLAPMPTALAVEGVSNPGLEITGSTAGSLLEDNAQTLRGIGAGVVGVAAEHPTKRRGNIRQLATVAAASIGLAASTAPAVAYKSSHKVDPSMWNEADYGLNEGTFEEIHAGQRKDMVTVCASDAVNPNITKAKIKYVNRSHSKVKITVGVDFYERQPWCQLAGDATYWVAQRIRDVRGKKVSPARRNTKWAVLNIRPGKPTDSVILPARERTKCPWEITLLSRFKPIPTEGLSVRPSRYPFQYKEEGLGNWYKCDPVYRKRRPGNEESN